MSISGKFYSNHVCQFYVEIPLRNLGLTLPPFEQCWINCRISKGVQPLSIQYSAQRVGFFISCRVRYWKKYWVAGPVRGGGSDEMYDRVFLCGLFTLGYIWVFLGIFGYSWEFPGIPEYFWHFGVWVKHLMRTGAQILVFSKGATNY